MFKDPFVISSIILAIAFLFILFYNLKLKNKWIKLIFLLLAICFFITIIILDNNFIYDLLRSVITYFWYPNYLIFIITILLSIIIFMYTLLNKNIKTKTKIKNYILFSLVFSLYIIYLRQNIDTSLYTSLYSDISLILMRIVTIMFTIWIIVTIIFKIVDRGRDEK